MAPSLSPAVAVCITGEQLPSFWFDASAMARGRVQKDLKVPDKVGIFAAVPEQHCAAAEERLGRRFVRCVGRAPVRNRFLPNDVLKHRLLKACLAMALMHDKYDWILHKRSDVFLREFPSQFTLAAAGAVVLTATKPASPQQILDEKLFLARPAQIRHILAVSTIVSQLANSSSRLSHVRTRLHRVVLASTTELASVLQRFLQQRRVPVQPLKSLRYEDNHEQKAVLIRAMCALRVEALWIEFCLCLSALVSHNGIKATCGANFPY